MSNNFEIHCIKVEKTQTSSSVKGEVSGGGTGGSSVTGETNTTHTSQVTAAGKMYTINQKNSSYPFTEGDEMVLLCQKNSNGMYEISSLINNSNGTRLLGYSPMHPLVPLSALWLLAIISIPFFNVYIALIICVFTVFYTIKKHPIAKEDFEKETNMVKVFMSLEGAKCKESLKKGLIGYEGSYLIGEGV